jgi:hypothetical protein
VILLYTFIGRWLQPSAVSANNSSQFSARCDQLLETLYGIKIGSYRFILGSFATSLLTVLVATFAMGLALHSWVNSNFPENGTPLSTYFSLLIQFYPVVVMYSLIPGLLSMITTRLLTMQWRKESGPVTGILFIFTNLVVSLLLGCLFVVMFAGFATAHIDAAIQAGFANSFSNNYVVTAAGLGLGSIILAATGSLAVVFPTVLLWSYALATLVYNAYAKVSGNAGKTMPAIAGGVIVSIFISILFLLT